MHIKAQCRSRAFLALRTRWLLGTRRGGGCGGGDGAGAGMEAESPP